MLNDTYKTWGPIPMGARVRLLRDYDGVPVGTLGTVTWKHPTHLDGVATGFEEMPYRVIWDGWEPKPGDLVMGMSDIGWLTRADEIEVT